MRYIRKRFRNHYRNRFHRRRRWNPRARVRTTPRHTGAARPSSKYCESCGSYTQEGKPFCSEHVERHSYIAELLSKLAEKDAEINRVRHQGPSGISENSIIAKDILIRIRVDDAKTAEGLAKELGLDTPLIREYINYLMDRNKIVPKRGPRGVTLYRIAPASLRRYRRRLQRRRRRLRRNPWQTRSWHRRRRHFRRRNPWW